MFQRRVFWRSPRRSPGFEPPDMAISVQFSKFNRIAFKKGRSALSSRGQHTLDCFSFRAL
jgi:hypothetical protein